MTINDYIVKIRNEIHDKALKLITNKSLYNFYLNDDKENGYQVFIYSDNAKKQIASFDAGNVWAGANQGDVLYQGDFKIGYVKDGEYDIQTVDLKNTAGDGPLTINKSKNLIFSIQNKGAGNPDLLLIGQPAASMASAVQVYYIKDGKLTLCKFSDNEGTENMVYTCDSASLFFRQLNDNSFETSGYSQMDALFGINTWKFNKDTGSFTSMGTRSMSIEEYQHYAR